MIIFSFPNRKKEKNLLYLSTKQNIKKIQQNQNMNFSTFLFVYRSEQFSSVNAFNTNRMQKQTRSDNYNKFMHLFYYYRNTYFENAFLMLQYYIIRLLTEKNLNNFDCFATFFPLYFPLNYKENATINLKKTCSH